MVDYLNPELLIYYLLIIIVTLIATIYGIVKPRKKEQSIISKDEFLVVSHILENLIEEYKAIILSDQIIKLQKQHDIDPNSKTNAIDLYNEKYNKLIKRSSKEIFRTLSKSVLNKLLSYYTQDGLILHIIYLLKR